MVHNASTSGGQGAVEFNDSREVGSVESRISLIRALVEDIAHNGEGSYTHQITVDDKIWNITIQPANR